jgi:type I restriction enzyme M protein
MRRDVELAEDLVEDVEPAGKPVEAVAVSLADDETIDFITGRPVKQRGNERVRQQIARSLSVEYGIPVDDMARDFPIPVEIGGARRGVKKADIAVFAPGEPHTPENLQRVVICKPEPKGGRAVTKLRTHDQARQDLAELEVLLSSDKTPQARYGMWTNGLDFFFLHRDAARFGARFEPRANWPIETSAGGPMPSAVRMRRGEAAMLKTVFRRCHNYVHGNEGLPKDAAFWQFLYVLFAKIYDEQVVRRTHSEPRFFAFPHEPFEEAGRQAIRDRVLSLFKDVKTFYPLFETRDQIALSARALAFIVGELAAYDLSGTDVDVKGLAYQELVGANLRGDRGQYFTPKGAVELMVRILDPQEDESVLDPACGTGGFLRETLRHLLNRWRENEGTAGLPDKESQLLTHQERLDKYAREHLFGADFDPFLVRATSMSVMLFTGRASENIYYMDSLAFDGGDLPGVAEAKKRIPLPGSVDVVMTNPPFGTDIKIEDDDILDRYRDGVAQPWVRDRETGKVEAALGGRVTGVSPEQLFIQRAVEWVRPGGRVGIVLPNGILSNPGPVDYAIRRWILDHCWVLASVELPVETFVVEANVNILTSLLFLKKKTDQERRVAGLGQAPDYPVFMAVAENVGFDRRGNPVLKRHPDGTAIVERVTVQQRVIRKEGEVIRSVDRPQEVVDDDLPEIAKAYRRFRARYPEPGTGQ